MVGESTRMNPLREDRAARNDGAFRALTDDLAAETLSGALEGDCGQIVGLRLPKYVESGPGYSIVTRRRELAQNRALRTTAEA